MSDEFAPEIIDQIVFGMENQESNFVFDTEEHVVIPKKDTLDAEEGMRYIDLPKWNSVMGFHLMERFVSTLRNPVFRDVLRETLASGHGVFRKFKNALKGRQDIERLWFRFKEKEMRKLVVEWYNEYRETVGLSRIAFEEEETSELILSDFSVREPEELSPERIAELAVIDRNAFCEMYSEYPDGIVERLFDRLRQGKSPSAGSVVLAETPTGELAGFLWFEEERAVGDIDIGWIHQLTVVPEFRGLGIARSLFDRYLSLASSRQIDRLFVEVGGAAGEISRVLETTGFEAHSTTYTLDVYHWADGNPGG